MTHPQPPAIASLESFEVLERLGEGAMATVWRARHRQSGQPVAIKAVKGDDAPSERQARRPAQHGLILREARSMAAMAHPNIVRILDFGHLDGADAASDYIVMELAEDGCLDPAAITDWPALRECLLQVLDGLAHAHSRERVHLDLKPPNILLDNAPCSRPRYMIADFGIAHRIVLQRHFGVSSSRRGQMANGKATARIRLNRIKAMRIASSRDGNAASGHLDRRSAARK